MSLETRNEWKGPLLTTHLKERLRAMKDDILACSDADELCGVVVSRSPEMEQAKHDLPDWHEALKGFIDSKFTELTEGDDYGLDGKG